METELTPKERFNRIIDELIKEGIAITLSFNGDENHIVADLNTKAKSHCYLYYTDSGVFTSRRYERIEEVKSVLDVIDHVHDCSHGREYFNESWLTLFNNHGMRVPWSTLL